MSWSHNRLVTIMETGITVKTVIILKQGSEISQRVWAHNPHESLRLPECEQPFSQTNASLSSSQLPAIQPAGNHLSPGAGISSFTKHRDSNMTWQQTADGWIKPSSLYCWHVQNAVQGLVLSEVSLSPAFSLMAVCKSCQVTLSTILWDWDPLHRDTFQHKDHLFRHRDSH